MELADIQFLSDFTYYTYQRDLIIPVINEHAKISAQNLIEKVKKKMYHLFSANR